MLQAAVLYRLFLYPVPFSDDGFTPAEVDIGRGYCLTSDTELVVDDDLTL